MVAIETLVIGYHLFSLPTGPSFFLLFLRYWMGASVSVLEKMEQTWCLGSSDNLRESLVQPAVKFLFSRICLTFHLAIHHVLIM